jgi:hypothetical protein
MLNGRVLPTHALVVSSHRQVLVRWEALPPSESTWEDVKEFKKLYPTIRA